jgi:hypothetical protein
MFAWYDLVFSTMLHPPSHYAECIGSSSMDACSTGNQKICKVNNLWLLAQFTCVGILQLKTFPKIAMMETGGE